MNGSLGILTRPCPVCFAVAGEWCRVMARNPAPIPPSMHAGRFRPLGRDDDPTGELAERDERDHDGEHGPAGEVPPMRPGDPAERHDAPYAAPVRDIVDRAARAHRDRVPPALDLGIADSRALDAIARVTREREGDPAEKLDAIAAIVDAVRP